MSAIKSRKLHNIKTDEFYLSTIKYPSSLFLFTVKLGRILTKFAYYLFVQRHFMLLGLDG